MLKKGFNGIFFGEDLNKIEAELLYLARMARNEGKLKKCGTLDCCVYITTNSKEKVLVYNAQHLTKITGYVQQKAKSIAEASTSSTT